MSSGISGSAIRSNSCNYPSGNIMRKKLGTYWRYFYDYLTHGEFFLLFVSGKYMLRNIPLKQDKICKCSIGRFSLRSGTNDFQFSNLAYEYDVTRYFLDHHKEYTTFIDIGAHIGRYSILMGNKGLKCYAFEPMNENFDALRMNVQLNHLEGEIMLFNLGLGSADGVQDFFLAPVNKGSSHSGSKQRKTIDYGNHSRVTAKIRAFDNILPELPLTSAEKILVKIDAEGMECEILEGASGFLRTCENIMLIIETKHSGEENIRRVLDKTGNFGYEVIDADNISAFKRSVSS